MNKSFFERYALSIFAGVIAMLTTFVMVDAIEITVTRMSFVFLFGFGVHRTYQIIYTQLMENDNDKF